MDNHEIYKIMRKDRLTRKYFCGVIPINLLPMRKVNRPCGYIVNTQPIPEPGEHWFAIYISRSNRIEYFDPYGIKPINGKVYEFFKINGNKYIINKKKIQHDKSINCGKFCVFYLYFKSRGYTMHKILRFFVNNSKYNDYIINKFYKMLN